MFPSQSVKGGAICPEGHGRIALADIPQSIASWRKYVAYKPLLDVLPIAEKVRVNGKATRHGKRLHCIDGGFDGYVIVKASVAPDATPSSGNVLAKAMTETSVFVREFTSAE